MFSEVFEPEDDPLWLEHLAEINTIDNIAVLMVFILLFYLTYSSIWGMRWRSG